MRLLILLFILLIGVVGCAVLNQPIIEILPARLSCETNPGLVDGNLETVSTFAVNGFIKKEYQIFNRHLAYAERQYLTKVEGNKRTEAIIKLDVPTYVSYVEVYPASRISNFALMTTTEEPPRFDVSFEAVHDKQHQDIEGVKPVKFQIGREVLYLRLSADGMEDRQNSVKGVNSRVKIPLKGASIREVKFYSMEINK